MRTAIAALLLFAPLAPRCEMAPVDALAALCDLGRPEFERDLATVLLPRLPASLETLTSLSARARTREGRAMLDRLVRASASRLREALREPQSEALSADLARILPTLPVSLRWTLGMETTEDGHLVVYFNSHTFDSPGRRQVLEYLICPDAPAGKAYECLAGMRPAEWEEFSLAWRGGSRILLRWRDEEDTVRTSALADLLPWAAPVLERETGLKLGGNHDESANPLLPPDRVRVQIGLVLP